MGLESFADCPHESEKRILISMVYRTTLTDEGKQDAINEINGCSNYTHYQRLFYSLEHIQQSIHEIINPNETDVVRHIRKFIK